MYRDRIVVNIRRIVQLASTAFVNGYAAGFFKGKIFTGKTKLFCVPVLNCYSCPGALESCPVGALQAVIGDRKYQFSFYVLGLIMLFGILAGRSVCGFLCPFGLFQELIHKIPIKKHDLPQKADKSLRYLKYVILVLFVFILPMFLTNQYGMGSPYFCKLICPAGTLEGGIPLVLLQTGLRDAIGVLFKMKTAILIAVVLSAVFAYRPFCKYFCPLGALYALFNKFSFYQIKLDKDQCIHCKVCEKVCKMNVKITENINSAECIRCGDCIHACPEKALYSSFSNIPQKEKMKK